MEQTELMRFVFTPDGFHPDASGYSEENRKWFEEGGIPALYALGAGRRPENLSASGAFLYQVSSSFFQCLTDSPQLELDRAKAKVNISETRMDALLNSVPFTVGAENVNARWIRRIFHQLLKIFHKEIKAYDGTVQMYLTEKNQNLHVPERIFFHLVENREGDEEYPFAFMATYASKGEDGKVHHYPLKYALTQYGGDRKKLISLLSCLNQASEVSPVVKAMAESGELFHPLRFTADDAFAFLQQAEEIEKCGILCRIPDWWRKKQMNVSLQMVVGEKAPSLLGFDSIMETTPELTVDGMKLTKADIRKLLAQSDGLAMIKGRWVHVDHARLKELLKRMDSAGDTVTMMQALRMQMEQDDKDPDNGEIITNGKWLSSLLNRMRHPEKIRDIPVPDSVHAVLRPYQKTGYEWLNYMGSLGFGACLADDMGLGKTLQVLTYLEHMRLNNSKAKVLLVVPASLIGNWVIEAGKFTPQMDVNVLHGKPKKQLEEEIAQTHFLNLTTYGMVNRLQSLGERTWDCLILDEAQAIKNPLTHQTRAVKKIPARMRLALTGTPIENDLGNLWSLFDFLDKGLLGSSESFRKFCSNMDTSDGSEYARLKGMISPFLLRRMKTDKTIIKDLPDKIEMVDYASLSAKQAVLYRQVTDHLAESVEALSGMERRGLVLAALTKLKQICNHPDEYLGDNGFSPEESGKFMMLKDLCETIRDKRERVLVFTQFREMTEPLAAYLAGIFGAEGYVIHGGVPPKKRTEIVNAFQSDLYVPFIVCSLKAAGTGLNLTRANHVIHFDRWWNPAVENQATDRAFRIGQQKNVMVHKLVCRGTIEEKIDTLINSKKELAENVIGASEAGWITELSNEDLMNLLRLE
ncbi:MAG: DEAD/DEAH box helicase [Solobacterium sp.]|jgi:non-specific serine/threonine protein kinase|nr:DEAD/DEAH box helicase [Solobacterium sp.]MCH4048427.1 DEAD/DEAH box helicase [Solobacterium sp.]MCH4074721.1 DEAD/DEAH box helicase [Solobacterium sp.]MCI1313902.1 DEAD/DEAH box helicase [Solobacterium sp.]MCI1346437.1 DEAD/DEAH box helicase [Solobacterium sp.]